MKTKLLVLVLLVAMLATLLFSMTSCGLFGGDDDDTTTTTSQTPPRGPGEVTTAGTPAERVPSGWGPEEGIN